jgi:hypothetical protein
MMKTFVLCILFAVLVVFIGVVASIAILAPPAPSEMSSSA